MVCDHTSFESVRTFCDDLIRELDEESERMGYTVGIDVLCLNAAIFLGEDTEPQFTNDGLELTLQTNHFAPFLIANLLFERINPGARVVVTSSGLHAIPTTSFGNFEGVIDAKTGRYQEKFEMIDGSEFDHKRCYAISKLCNVAFCLALNRRLRAERDAVAVCFT
jgi:NAD(P)-dependent dehydrogenase (short-subunit alcohol dehydrogenase family)